MYWNRILLRLLIALLRRFELFFTVVSLKKSICWNENIFLPANIYSISHSSLTTDFHFLDMLMCDWIDISYTEHKSQKQDGKVTLRAPGLPWWYVARFEEWVTGMCEPQVLLKNTDAYCWGNAGFEIRTKTKTYQLHGR